MAETEVCCNPMARSDLERCFGCPNRGKPEPQLKKPPRPEPAATAAAPDPASRATPAKPAAPNPPRRFAPWQVMADDLPTE